MWDKEYIDMITPGYIEFTKDGLGQFHFGCVEAAIDYRISTVGNSERIEFTFEGEDEGDPKTGRGWAVIKDKKLEGRIFFHMGDDSDFIADKT